MPVDKSDAQKAREVQDQPRYRRKCHICGREWYDSLIGPCPERDGRQVCMYCCRLCEQHYREPGQTGQGCRVKDAARAAGRGSPHPALRATFPQGKAGEGAATFPQGKAGGGEKVTDNEMEIVAINAEARRRGLSCGQLVTRATAAELAEAVAKSGLLNVTKKRKK